MYRAAMRNLLLSCIVIFFGLSAVACKDGGPPPEMDVIAEALAEPGAMVLDVRSAGEYAGGHAEGAVHVPVKQVSARMPTIQPDKDQQIIVYCAVGVRAADAEKQLRSLGYTKILNAKTPEAVAKAMGKELVK
jgi:rhodanese-related sulfurtransferase